MKTLAVACSLFAVVCFAAEPTKTTPTTEKGTTMGGEKAMWKPSKVTKKDTAGIEQLYKTADEAWKKQDMDAAASLHDFPVFMATDNSAGAVFTDNWNKEHWLSEMKGAMENWPKDAKYSHKTKPTFITNTIAFVEETNTMTVGKNTETWVSGSMVVLKDGKWLFKSGIEGGWGDLMPPKKEVLAPTNTTPPATNTAATGTKPAANPTTK